MCVCVGGCRECWCGCAGVGVVICVAPPNQRENINTHAHTHTHTHTHTHAPAGFVPTENLRFRDESLTFKVAENSINEEEVKKFNNYEYPAMVKTQVGGWVLCVCVGGGCFAECAGFGGFGGGGVGGLQHGRGRPRSAVSEPSVVQTTQNMRGKGRAQTPAHTRAHARATPRGRRATSR